MDIEKEREAFESWFESRYGAHFMQFALDLDFYVDKHTQTCWEAWQAAKAQALPEGFVLVSKDTLNKALNPNDYDEAVCSANELLAVIEAQHPSSTSDCPDEP